MYIEFLKQGELDSLFYYVFFVFTLLGPLDDLFKWLGKTLYKTLVKDLVNWVFGAIKLTVKGI